MSDLSNSMVPRKEYMVLNNAILEQINNAVLRLNTLETHNLSNKERDKSSSTATFLNVAISGLIISVIGVGLTIFFTGK